MKRSLVALGLIVWLFPFGVLAQDFLNVTYHTCYDGDTCTEFSEPGREAQGDCANEREFVPRERGIEEPEDSGYHSGACFVIPVEKVGRYQGVMCAKGYYCRDQVGCIKGSLCQTVDVGQGSCQCYCVTFEME